VTDPKPAEGVTVDSFAGKLAVVTSGGSGMGLELARGLPEPQAITDAQLAELIPPGARAGLISAGALPEGASADDLRQMLAQANTDFRDKAPLSAAQAATIILDEVRSGAWRILVGEDAKMIDAAVRANPEAAYDYAELFSWLAEEAAEKTPER
jgi:NAD(P)-dependent dehydrogenase (short-subunit alcohol dehydrogenase family)